MVLSHKLTRDTVTPPLQVGMPVLLRTCLSNIKSVLIPRPKSHIRFYAQGGVSLSQNRFEFSAQSYIASRENVNVKYWF